MTATATKIAANHSLPASTLAELLRRSVPSKDPTRTHLNALRFEGGRVLSTDGHRIHNLAAPMLDVDATVPIWALEAALASIAAAPSASPVTITPVGSTVMVATSEGTIQAKQPKFPPIAAVYPRRNVEPKLTLTLRISEAVRELRRLRQAGAGVALSGVRLCLTSESYDVVRFRAHTSALAEGEATAMHTPWDVKGPAWTGEIGFNADYLRDAIAAAKAARAAEVTLEVWGQTDPALLTWDGGDAVVMPMRL